MNEKDILAAHVKQALPDGLSPWPGGWPGEIDAALIDAVFSIRARYGNRERRTGVIGGVLDWRDARTQDCKDDLAELAKLDPATLKAWLPNNAQVSGRAKRDVVQEAAAALVTAGVRHAAQLDPSDQAQQRAYLGVRGCGWVTWSYFGMLLGHPDFKPDSWIMRFVDDALPGVAPERAKALLNEIAQDMGVDATRLDHSLWLHQRHLGAGRRSDGSDPRTPVMCMVGV